MDLKETDILGEYISQHWYYKSKALAMMAVIGEENPSSVLDVGAGSGFFSRYLLTESSAREAWCVDISYESDFDAAESGKPIYFRRSVESVSADLVLLMDVLEHVDDDVQLLKDYVEKCANGTQFLISVPSFQMLWSGHDVFLGHKRRYSLRQLEKVAVDAGLAVKHGMYYFGAVFPIAAATRIFNRLTRSGPEGARSQLSRHHPLVNDALSRICKAELGFMHSNRFVGLTAFCLAEKAVSF